MDIWTIFGILFLLTLMQLIGMRVQMRSYKKVVQRLHKLGNVGIGSKRGFGAGNIVIIACDGKGSILAGEIMEGMTIFSSFRKMEGIEGKTIYALKDEYLSQHKGKKRYKGHLQALEALEMRLKSNGAESGKEGEEDSNSLKE